MTPREVLLVMRAATDRRLTLLDDLTYAVWHGAYYGRVEKLPKLADEMPSKRRAKRRPLTVEQDIARWQTFFGAAGRAN